MWQKCPICNGTGYDTTTKSVNTTQSKCPTCKGERIISTLNGKPPVKQEIGQTTPYTGGNVYKIYNQEQI